MLSFLFNLKPPAAPIEETRLLVRSFWVKLWSTFLATRLLSLPMVAYLMLLHCCREWRRALAARRMLFWRLLSGLATWRGDIVGETTKMEVELVGRGLCSLLALVNIRSSIISTFAYLYIFVAYVCSDYRFCLNILLFPVSFKRDPDMYLTAPF